MGPQYVRAPSPATLSDLIRPTTRELLGTLIVVVVLPGLFDGDQLIKRKEPRSTVTKPDDRLAYRVLGILDWYFGVPGRSECQSTIEPHSLANSFCRMIGISHVLRNAITKLLDGLPKVPQELSLGH